MADEIIWQLRIGTRLTGFTVEPDGKWSGMWRIHTPRGNVSDMYNLSWARDHCIKLARPRGLGGGEKIFWDRREIIPAPGPDGISIEEAPR